MKRSKFGLGLSYFLSCLRDENVRSEVADVAGNVRYIRKSLWNSLNNVFGHQKVPPSPHAAALLRRY